MGTATALDERYMYIAGRDDIAGRDYQRSHALQVHALIIFGHVTHKQLCRGGVTPPPNMCVHTHPACHTANLSQSIQSMNSSSTAPAAPVPPGRKRARCVLADSDYEDELPRELPRARPPAGHQQVQDLE